jgi:hypothetical protein
MADMRPIVKLHEQWWQRENTEVLVAHYSPSPVRIPCGGLDIEVPPSEMADRKERNALAQHASMQDMLVTALPDFSTAFRPAVLGAGFESDGHTSWSIPVAESAAELEVEPFDPNHPLYQEYLARLQPLLDNWSWETYLPTCAGVLGPLDVLSALLGPSNLALELYLHPEDVKRCAMDAARATVEMMEYELALLRDAGFTDGMACRFSVWLPEDGALFTEDFSALVGEEHYREFFIDPDAATLRALPASLYHVHSAADKCMPAMLDTPGVTAFEFGNDPHGPDTDTRIAVAQSIQEAGCPLQMGSWNVPLPREEMERIVRALDPRGLIIRFQAQTWEESCRLYDWVKELAAQGY